MEDGTRSGICSECDSTCKDCQLSSKQCTECADDYYMMGWKCLMENEVAFELMLDGAGLEEFKAQVEEFKKEMSVLVFGDDTHTSRIRVDTITEGSIIIKGSVQADSPSQQ